MNVHQNAKLTPAGRALLVEPLRRRRWSTPRISRETGIPLSTVGAECRRLGLGQLPSLEPPVPVIRYERDRPGEKGVMAAGFLRRKAAWFERQGVKVERVMADNGSCYRSKVFRRVVEEFQAYHIFTRPYTPRTNGKAQRVIRTAKELWAYARPY